MSIKEDRAELRRIKEHLKLTREMIRSLRSCEGRLEKRMEEIEKRLGKGKQ